MSSYGKYRPGQKAWPTTDCSGDPGFTVQASRDEADINKVIARFQKSGVMPPILRGEPFYGDVSDFGGLAESLIMVQDAERLFGQYPANVRERFQNDYVKFVEFMEDPNNLDEACDLGVAVRRPVLPGEDSPPPPPAAPPAP